MRGILPLGMAAALAAAGCTTTLQTRHVSAGQEPEPVQGVLYSLPMTAFDVEAQVLVVSCDASKAHLPDGPLGYELTKGTIRSYWIPDPHETYSIDYPALNSPLKATTFEATFHPNGMIKTINADIEDKVFDTMVSAGEAALNLYRMSFGLVAAPMSAAAGASACNGYISDRLKERAALLGKSDPASKARFEALTSDLTATLRLHAWIPNPQDASKKETSQKGAPGTEICESFPTKQNDFLRGLALRDKVTPMTAHQKAKFAFEVCITPVLRPPMAAPAAIDGHLHHGLVYRFPAYGTIRIHDTDGRNESLNHTELVSLPQFGVKGLLSLDNQAFDHNTIKVSFNEDGSISALDFTAQASAQKAAAAASDASGKLSQAASQRAAARAAESREADAARRKVTQDRLDDMEDRIKLMTKEMELDKLTKEYKEALGIP